MESNFDSYFKENVRQEIKSWDKSIAWNKLNKKRKIKLRNKILTSTVILFVIISLPFFYIKNMNYPNQLSETQKREKLFKIEQKLSDKHGEPFICDNCKFRKRKTTDS